MLNQKTEKSGKEKPRIKILLLALFVMVIILSSVIVLRLMQNKPLLPAGESYYNLRIAQALKTDLFLSKDQVQNTLYYPNPYHYLLALLLLITSPGVVSVLAPLILGITSAIIFFKLLTLLGIKYDDSVYSIVILAVTPVFITIFTGLYLYGFTLFVSLLIIFLVIIGKKSKYTLVLASLMLLVLALTSFTGFLITFILLLVLCSALKRKVRTIMIPFIPSVIALAFLSFFSIYAPILPGFHTFEFRYLLSVIGADLGFDLFLMLLFFAGFIILWTRNEEQRLLHLAVLGFLVLSFFNIVAMIFSSFMITPYCVAAITYFYRRKWQLEIIRTGTLLLLLCGLVFSLTNQINMLVQAPSDRAIQDALLSLKSLDAGRVLSAEDNGFLIEFYSDKPVVLDQNSFLTSQYNELKQAAEQLFMTPRLKEAEPLIQSFEIRYILITPDMKEALWGGREEGLWFLVKNSDSFARKYNRDGIEVWEYKPDTGA